MQDHGALALEHVPEGLLVKHVFVVILGGKVATVEQRRRKPEPVDRVEENTVGKCRLDVFLQKALLEILEDAVPEEPEIGRRETPAGNTRNDVGLVREPSFLAAQADLGGLQLLEDAV